MDPYIKLVLGNETKELVCVCLEFIASSNVVEQCWPQELGILG